jgi:hypothetical protein
MRRWCRRAAAAGRPRRTAARRTAAAAAMFVSEVWRERRDWSKWARCRLFRGRPGPAC